MIHAATNVLKECRKDQSETIGRATALIDVLNEFVKEPPRADRLEATLRAAMRLADLLEARRWPERIDRNILPNRPQHWTFVLAGDTHEGNDFSESLESLGFSVKNTEDFDMVVSVHRGGPMVLLATISWLKANAERFVHTLPAGDGLPDSYLLVAVVDVADFCSHVIARQAGARLLLNLPLDVGSLVGELTGLAWMPRSAFRVLLVDDDAAALELSADILRAAGFEVLALTDPASAPNFIEEFSPDTCVLGMEMRACRGTDLAALLRRNLRFARLPVVYLSTFADSRNQLDARVAGANDFLVKPVDARLLVAAVMTQARQHRMLDTACRQQYQARQRIAAFRGAIDAHIALSVTDTIGAIVDVNQKFCEMSGYRREELLGRNHRIIKSGHHSPVVFDDMWQTISTGGIWQGEVQSRRKDGELYWAWSTVAPMLDAYGMPEQYVAIRTDITEQKRVQVELNNNNRLLDLLRQALERFVSTDDLQDFSGQLLDGILALTQSAYGFIGGVLHDEDGTPYLRTHAITDISWNEETRQLHKETRVRGMEFRNLDTLFGAVLKSGEPVKTHDDYTYLHSVAVCALMLSLARQLNLDDEQARLAGLGGLMHDLGKAAMPLEVLNKPGKLTDAEFAIVKRHPVEGEKMLRSGGAEPAALDIALHHHEKMNGTGYPDRLAGDAISLLARMGAVCDVYDAVTSVRAYKCPWDPSAAMRQMSKWEGHFDKRIFSAFVKAVGIYPVGSLVRLSSQRLVVVVEPGKESLLTPIVRIFFSLRSNEPIPMQTIDLAAPSCKDSIAGPEDPIRWNFTNIDDLWMT